MAKQINIDQIYNALTCLGHVQLWMRDKGKYNRHIITWDNYVVASYNAYRKSWIVMKNSFQVNDNLLGKSPNGPGSELTELTDSSNALQQLFYGDW